MYFTHSYQRAGDGGHRGVTNYVEPFAAAVERGNVMGVQFHPEKSGDDGAADSAQFSGGAAMLTKRIIACLDVACGRVVKGVQFVDLVDAGDPAELAHAMRAKARTRSCCSISRRRTKAGRRCWIRCAARRASCSFRSRWAAACARADDAAAVFDAGADKISVNSAAIADPR